MCIEYSVNGKIMQLTGVAKSNVRVARVVHLLVWATDFFQLSCPWTTSRVEEYKKIHCN